MVLDRRPTRSIAGANRIMTVRIPTDDCHLLVHTEYYDTNSYFNGARASVNFRVCTSAGGGVGCRKASDTVTITKAQFTTSRSQLTVLAD
jgi:hypothetical protein